MKKNLKQKTQIKYVDKLPKINEFGSESLIIYDEKLVRLMPGFGDFIRTAPRQYAVKSGERLKDIDSFPLHLKRIAKLIGNGSPRKITIVAIGGGTVGDFAGFVASVFKRGVALVHIPSTWLSAIDSAHGGKTGMNLDGVKNQIGTFYSAQRIYIVKALLMTQPLERSFEASSELLKIALLSGGPLWEKLSKVKNFNQKIIWSLLPMAITAKYDVVHKDPFEKKGTRYLLNLGHTMGHVFESMFSFPHGVAIMCGLEFAILWSQSRNIMTEKSFNEMNSLPIWKALIQARSITKWKNLNYPSLLLESEREYLAHLNQDKKKQNSKAIQFIFISKPGRPLIQEVQISEIMEELRHQRRVFS